VWANNDQRLGMINIKIVVVLFFLSAMPWGGWGTELQNDFKYQSDGFSCTIKNTGAVENLKIGNSLLIRNIILHGRYKGSGHDCRFFPEYEEKSPVIISENGSNSFVLEKKGALSNTRYMPGALYSEKISITSHEIKFEYEVELKAEFNSNSNILITIVSLPVDTFLGKGFKIENTNGSSEFKIFPAEYEKSNSLHMAGIRNIRISLDEGILEIGASDSTSSFYIGDSRAWKEQSFRIDFGENIVWRNSEYTYMTGHKFKWAFVIRFQKHIN